MPLHRDLPYPRCFSRPARRRPTVLRRRSCRGASQGAHTNLLRKERGGGRRRILHGRSHLPTRLRRRLRHPRLRSDAFALAPRCPADLTDRLFERKDRRPQEVEAPESEKQRLTVEGSRWKAEHQGCARNRCAGAGGQGREEGSMRSGGITCHGVSGRYSGRMRSGREGAAAGLTARGRSTPRGWTWETTRSPIPGPGPEPARAEAQRFSRYLGRLCVRPRGTASSCRTGRLERIGPERLCLGAEGPPNALPPFGPNAIERPDSGK